MTDRIITTMEKNSQEEIRFSLQVYRGTDLIDIRVYYKRGDGKRIPTKKGISISLELFEEFLECLELVKETVDNHG